MDAQTVRAFLECVESLKKVQNPANGIDEFAESVAITAQEGNAVERINFFRGVNTKTPPIDAPAGPEAIIAAVKGLNPEQLTAVLSNLPLGQLDPAQLTALLGNLPLDQLNLDQAKAILGNLPVDAGILDNLLGGGLPTDAVTGALGGGLPDAGGVTATVTGAVDQVTDTVGGILGGGLPVEIPA